MVGMGDVRVSEAASRGFFDKEKFAKHLRDNALPPFGQGACATFVRKALVAAGLDTRNNPVPAKDYGPFLMARMFQVVSADGYVPLIGDIVVISDIPHHPSGHIQGRDRAAWISDFIQPRFYPSHAYENPAASYVIYRRL